MVNLESIQRVKIIDLYFPDHLPMDHGIYVGQIIEADGKPN